MSNKNCILCLKNSCEDIDQFNIKEYLGPNLKLAVENANNIKLSALNVKNIYTCEECKASASAAESLLKNLIELFAKTENENVEHVYKSLRETEDNEQFVIATNPTEINNEESSDSESKVQSNSTTDDLKCKKRKRSNSTLDASKHNLGSDAACVICGKQFRNVQLLRSHMKNYHMGGNAKVCLNCGGRFGSIKLYQTHIFSEKCKNLKYPCQSASCNKRFGNLSKVRYHMEKYHGGISE